MLSMFGDCMLHSCACKASSATESADCDLLQLSIVELCCVIVQPLVSTTTLEVCKVPLFTWLTPMIHSRRRVLWIVVLNTRGFSVLMWTEKTVLSSTSFSIFSLISSFVSSSISSLISSLIAGDVAWREASVDPTLCTDECAGTRDCADTGERVDTEECADTEEIVGTEVRVDTKVCAGDSDGT